MASLYSGSKTKKSWAIKLSFSGISVVERQRDNLAGGVLANSQTSRACFGRILVFGAIEEHGWLRDRKTTKNRTRLYFKSQPEKWDWKKSESLRQKKPTTWSVDFYILLLKRIYTFLWFHNSASPGVWRKPLNCCSRVTLLLPELVFFLSSPSKKHIWG